MSQAVIFSWHQLLRRTPVRCNIMATKKPAYNGCLQAFIYVQVFTAPVTYTIHPALEIK